MTIKGEKPRKVGVRIGFSKAGHMVRDNIAKRAAKRDARKGGTVKTAPLVAPVDAAINRLERATFSEREEQQRRHSYLKAVADRRIASSGSLGKRAQKTQAAVYRHLGLDQRAGFEGRPPAFEITESHKVGQTELLAAVRNCARDPIHILRTLGFMSERHHQALTAMVDLIEQHAAVGVRGIAYSEHVDGGRFPDVSAHAMRVARQMEAFKRRMPEKQRALLTAIAIDGMTIGQLARAGTFGTSHNTVKSKLTASLETLCNVFNISRTSAT